MYFQSSLGWQAVQAKSMSSEQPPTDEQIISAAMKNNEKVANYGETAVGRVYKALLRSGFRPENCLQIIKGHPDILQYSAREIDERFEMWHICQFTKTQFFELFVQCPELIDFDDEKTLRKLYSQLLATVSTPKNIWRLLMSSPNIIADDPKITQAKLKYILNSMEVDVPDLVKSGALGLSLPKIKSRHMLVVRLGFYKKRNWKASETDPNKNTRLFRITDSSEEEFAEKVCGISMKEFDAFNELYERELEEKVQEAIEYEENSDNDSDATDSDDDAFDPRENSDYYDDRNRARYKKKR